MTKPFVFDERTTSLYGPDGQFIKKIFCPKAVGWNQLLADDPLDRSRGCNQCDERILNLDKYSTQHSLTILNEEPDTCVYASINSQNVIFLKSGNPATSTEDEDDEECEDIANQDLPIITTARSFNAIGRGWNLGFWPDVRLVRYNTAEINEKMCVFQNTITGEVESVGDYRSGHRSGGGDWVEVIPWTNYYSHYQKVPIAAYLIPKNLPNNSEVFVPDPIEDYVGASWNQGDAYRARNLKGKVINRKVILDPSSIERIDFMG